MKKAIDSALQRAVESLGGRMTKQRLEIYELLGSLEKPITIQSITKKVHANEASVYRTIHFLKAAGLIEEIVYPDGSRRYALGHHHHHIICTWCGHTEHVSCEREEQSIQIDHPKFKTIDGHEITYYGTCIGCR